MPARPGAPEAANRIGTARGAEKGGRMSGGLAEGLRRFLAARGLKRPTGRPLYLYRTDDEEFEGLAGLLSEEGRRSAGVPGGEMFAAAFCLVAAEWWRRNHSGGPWKWDGVFNAAGLPSDLDRQRIYPVVRNGLRYWRRDLLKVGTSNAYLVTLACEGGLPLQLIHQQGTALRAYFRALLSEFQVYGLRGADPAELAARVARHLPMSLRQRVVYQLAGTLVKEIWELQATLGETHTPVSDLDRTNPGWRERLPLALSDDTARTLLNNLVDDASKLARRSGKGVRAGCRLERTPGGWRLRRLVLLPPSLSDSEAVDLMGAGEEVPYRFELYREDPVAGDECLALVTRRSAEDGARFVVEKGALRLRVLTGKRAVEPVRVYVGAGRRRHPAREVPGGTALSELPWVFVDRKGDGTEYEYVGEGTVRTRFPAAWVAVSAETTVETDEGASVRAVGRLVEIDREILEVRGSVVFEVGGHRVRVRTAQDRDEAELYTIEGPVLPVDAPTPLYRGVPRVRACAESGAVRTIPPKDLEWRIPGGLTRRLWFAVSDECLGPVELRHVVRGETRFARPVTVVPADARVELTGDEHGRGGEIRLAGFGRPDVGVEPVPGAAVIVQGPTDDDIAVVRLRVEGTAPASVGVRLRWSMDREVRFEVPFPAQGVRFLGRDGTELSNGEGVHVDRLGGVRVRALGARPGRYYLVEAVLHANDVDPDLRNQLWASERLVEVAPGRHELDLRALQEACRSLLAMTRELDAWVEVRVVDDTRREQPRHLRVRAYEAELEPDKDSGHVVLPDYDRGRFGEDEIRLEAFPLRDPLVESETLPVVEPFRWDFAPEQKAPGPWLITGRCDGRGFVRPLCWTVEPTEEAREPGTSGNGASPLLDAVAKPTLTERVEAFDAVLDRLAEDAGHPDWERLDAYLDRLADLPPGTFDVTSVLAQKPATAAAALLRAERDRFHRVWDTLERLPFSWLMVPVEAWVRCARRRYETVRDLAKVLGPEYDPDQLARDGFRAFLEEIPLLAPGMISTAQIVAHRALGDTLERHQELRLAQTEAGRAALCGGVLPEARQDLLRTHADDEWPGGGGVDEWFRHREDLPEEIRALYVEPPSGARFRAPVLNVPIAAAVAAAFGLDLPEGAVFHVRRVREFAPGWFDTAYGCALAAGIGWRCQHEEGVFDG